MYVLANTTVSILRGTGENAYGDEMDAGTVIRSGLIAQIVQMPSSSSRPFTPGVKVYQPATNVPSTIRQYACTLPYGTDVTNEDQILDERSGSRYQVIEVTNPMWEGIEPDLQLVLQRVTNLTPV
jgi:hypothetical protein